MEEELTDDPLCDKVLSPRLWGIILSTITEKSKYEQLMRSAFKLASKGLGYTSPNPAVGAIIIRDGKILSKGYHRRPGEAHAEINALKNFDGDARGAELITTLEPCAHHGKTPPCVDAIIESGIKKVISAIRDKNPLVQGRGFKRLREAGIEVIDGILAGDAEEYYAPYFKFITTGLPYVTIKFAQSLDGRIAATGGDSKWISSEKSLKYSHYLRKINDAILVGAGTLKKDNPLLTTRLVKGKNPIRLILSNSGKFDLRRNIFEDRSAKTFVITNRRNKLIKGLDYILVGNKGKRLNLESLLKKLGEKKISSLVVEGGAQTITSFFNQRLVDKIEICVAPMIIGTGISSIDGLGVRSIGKAVRLKDVEYVQMGPDMIVKGKPVWSD